MINDWIRVLYPFLELGLGILYAMGSVTENVLIATLALMLFSGLGVAIAMVQKKKFQCMLDWYRLLAMWLVGWIAF